MNTSRQEDRGDAREHPLLKKLKKQVAPRISGQLAFEHEVVNGVEWLTAGIIISEVAPARGESALWTAVSSHEIHYKPLGRVTLADVKYLRDKWQRALFRPVVVIASADGFDKEAMTSIKRSRWVDYFDEHHVPDELR